MHMLNIDTLKLEEARDETDKAYAILSHVWQQNHELLFADTDSLAGSQLSGAEKIRSFCQLIRDLNATGMLDREVHHVWVDTCCIDKKSSAELSEAINAMYSYYASAILCVAYLDDVEVESYHRSFDEQFEKSRWFTRCWTLQELLAPTDVRFYNKSWKFLGTKKSLSEVIKNITRIDRDALNGSAISKSSVAQRMSWAAGRHATRREDVAYSLMGLFGVNMPMLYGEGNKAFRRLQEAILADTDDETLFAWSWDDLDEPPDRHGLLAPSPDYFLHCRDIYPATLNERETTFHSTNRGVSGEITMLKTLDELEIPQAQDSAEPEVYLALLNAAQRTDSDEVFICVFLVREGAKGEWSRIQWMGFSLHKRSLFLSRTLKGRVQHIHVRHSMKLEMAKPAKILGFDMCSILSELSLEKPSRELITLTDARWRGEAVGAKEDYVLLSTKPLCPGILCMINCEMMDIMLPNIHLGFDLDSSPFCVASYSTTVLRPRIEDCNTAFHEPEKRIFYVENISETLKHLSGLLFMGVREETLECWFLRSSTLRSRSKKRKSSKQPLKVEIKDIGIRLTPFTHDVGTFYKFELLVPGPSSPPTFGLPQLPIGL